MHLLATIPGTIADGSAAIDLAQTPGDIVLLSSADTEIALLAAAQKRRLAQDPAAPRLRLAPILRLGHNFSVDLYMETVARARLVVARLLGGSGYWPYGVERLVETCRTHRVPLALVPGDDKPDPELVELSTLVPSRVQRLWRYLVEGGPANADNLLRYAGSLIGHEVPPHCCGQGCIGLIGHCRASTTSSRSGAVAVGSCPSFSTGRSSNRVTPRRSMHWSALSRRGACSRCRSLCTASRMAKLRD